jgi:hypothetical protein
VVDLTLWVEDGMFEPVVVVEAFVVNRVVVVVVVV